MREFEVINRFFDRPTANRSWIRKGIGDDGAVLTPSPGFDSVVVTDTSVSGVHFTDEQAAESVGYRSLAVNLSDIAAMGAEPKWATLNLTLEQPEPAWLEEFAKGFFRLADASDLTLVGGDTTKGPLCITATVGGEVRSGQGLYRSGAKVGDLIVVSGHLGGAAAALASGRTSAGDALGHVFQYPVPRLDLGKALCGIANSAIDISDGLLPDLQHVLRDSGGLGALIEADKIPLFDEACSAFGSERAIELALTGGDDYELCFTVSPSRLKTVVDLERACGVRLTSIGVVTESAGLEFSGFKTGTVPLAGYEHTW
ncbi:thiamine-phosphate kinase [Gammaproteobacteria bacterium]|nr:thiamine-phosphate kinase [Gammaproteobacteria bacterium]